MIQSKLHSRYGQILTSVAGALIYAVGMNFFVVPSNLYTGGFLGLSQVIRTLLWQSLGITGGFDFSGILNYALNVPIFYLAYHAMGKRFLRHTVIGVSCTTLFLSLLPVLQTPLIEERIAGCLIGGVICGTGIGTVLTGGCSTGGTDIIGLYLMKRGGFASVGKIGIIFNATLFAICGALISVETMIYSILYTVFSNMVLDRMYQQSINAEVLIITKHARDEIVSYITVKLHRGVTEWEGKGSYTGEAVHILCTCVTKYELLELQSAVKKMDAHAFCLAQEGAKVTGRFPRRFS